VHNLYFYLDLMKQARAAIRNGRFAAFTAEFLRDRAIGIESPSAGSDGRRERDAGSAGVPTPPNWQPAG
jgi:hypothetical protein